SYRSQLDKLERHLGRELTGHEFRTLVNEAVNEEFPDAALDFVTKFGDRDQGDSNVRRELLKEYAQDSIDTAQQVDEEAAASAEPDPIQQRDLSDSAERNDAAAQVAQAAFNAPETED